MFKITTAVVLSFVSCQPVFSQVNDARLRELPEVQHAVPQLSAADSNRLKQLFDSSEVVRHISLDKAIIILNEALEISRQKHFAGGVGHALTALAGCRTVKGQYAEAGQLLREAWSYCRVSGAKRGVLLVNWYNNMSNLMLRQGHFDQAYRSLDLAMREVRNAPVIDSAQLVLLYLNIAGLWHKEGSPDKALYYLYKGQAINDMIAPDRTEVRSMSIYNLLALSYDRKANYDSAEYYYRKVIRLASAHGNRMTLQAGFANLGNMYVGSGSLDSAEFYLKRGIDMAEEDRSDAALIASYFYMAKIYLARKEFSRARDYAQNALAAIQSAEASAHLSQVYQMLAVIYSEMGDHKQALHYFERHVTLKDSMFNDSKQRIISELDVKYHTAEKDNELTIQRLQLVQKEHKIQEKNLLLFGISAVVLSVSLLLVSRYRYQQRLHKERIHNLEKDQEINRLHAIMEGEEQERSRIAHELHDGIVSQLTAVKLNFSSLLQQDVLDKTAFTQGFRYLDETMQDLRKTAHNLMPETVIKSGLISSLQDFCRKMDNEHSMRIHFMTSGEPPVLEPRMALSLYRMVQELVQNAMKHAKAQNLLVQVNCQRDLLDITVEDDGVGIDEQKIGNGGTGLAHIRERVAIMNGHIEFINSGPGVTAYVEIPIPEAALS